MPYLIIIGPELALEQRKIMASELTEGIMEGCRFPDTYRDRISIQFFSYKANELAIGGRLLTETEEAQYYLRYVDLDLTPRKKEALLQTLFPLLMELLGIQASQAHRLLFQFENCNTEDIAVGGMFLTQLV